MKKMYTLVYNRYVETVDADTLLLRMAQAEEKGFHIEVCDSFFDYMVCFW